MTFMKNLLPFLLAASFSATPVFASVERQDGSRYDEELNESDFSALQDFVNTKRSIPLQEKTANLKLSGDVRFEWRHMTEKGRYGNIVGAQRRLRGGSARDYGDYPVSCNDFDAEFNAYFAYSTERTWAVAQIQYDESAGVFDNRKECPGQGPDTAQGVRSLLSDGRLDPDPEGWHGSGTCDNLCLKKAYMGYNIFTCNDSRFDVELGRRRLYHVFDSSIQFLSQFDGILFKYSDKTEFLDSWYINVAGFVINQRVNHFGWVAETGMMNICDSGFDVKYSFIDWKKNGHAQCEGYRNPDAFKFLNSQITVYYNLENDLFCNKKAQIYGAFLKNHNLHRASYFVRGSDVPRKARHVDYGWYVGFNVGDVVKEGDWSFNAEYQYVGALAVGDGDSRGIGRGNILDESFTTVERGNTNFKGFKFEFLYALTDNITIDTIIEWTKAAKKKIGGQHHYSKFELEAIYAF